jgi:hypothetical protein
MRFSLGLLLISSVLACSKNPLEPTRGLTSSDLAPMFVNDPLVPADDCAPANAQAVGHPAAANNQTPTWAANPLFSANNPGVSTGARGSEQAGPGCPAPTK